ncbi:MAG: NAD-dependent epimerase/dehydratase family protein [Candidatus Latescibacteria bacterium]|nr:NAD-dependent epimerase/dehydratase family protein [Candidatus Latescibacterota bacterium]
MAEKLRVLITGAAGQVGSTLWRAWEEEDRYTLTLADREPVTDARSRSEQGDIRDPAHVAVLCRDQDVLVHLAYLRLDDPRHPDGLTDIGVAMMLFEEARRAGVRKIVYASSNHASGWHERLGSPPPLATADVIRPDGWYGAMKGMAEIAGRYLVDAHDMRFIALRIGTFTGRREPSSLRLCSTLLTPRDGVQLFTRAIDYEGEERFLVTYGTSGNSDGYLLNFLDISRAVEVLGYRPQDNLIAEFRHRFQD